MIKTILTAIIMAAASLSYAQNCNFDVDSKDKFTGEVSRKVTQRVGDLTKRWTLTLEQRGERYYVGIKTLQGTAIQQNILQGEKFYLKLDDGKVITIAADQDYTPNLYASTSGVQTTIVTNGEIDVEDVKKMGNSPITDIKMTVGGRDLVLSSITNRQGDKIADYAECMYKLRKKSE